MFCTWSNQDYLKEVKKWYTKRKLKANIGKQQQQYRGVYHFGSDFYIEYLTTTKSEVYWSNAICVVLDKSKWSTFKNPVIKTESFLMPRYGCGYFFVTPEHANKKRGPNQYTIYVSNALHKELSAYGKLPAYVKTDVKLKQPWDILVYHKKELYGPLFTCNVAFM